MNQRKKKEDSKGEWQKIVSEVIEKCKEGGMETKICAIELS